MNCWWPAKRLHWPCEIKKPIAILAIAALLAADCTATSIVIVVTRHGIIVGADGKIIHKQVRGQPPPETQTTGMKLVIIQERIILANAGTRNIGNDTNAPYSFDTFVARVERNLQPKVTVSNFVDVLKAELSRTFFGFDEVLRTGALKPESLPPPREELVKYFLAGYEDGLPRVYEIALNIEWEMLRLRQPAVRIIHPVASRKNLTLTWVGGAERGIVELRDDQSEIAKKARAQMPLEVMALENDRELNMAQMRVLVCGLLNIEASRNPDEVGYPITIISLPPGDPLRRRTYRQNCQQEPATRN